MIEIRRQARWSPWIRDDRAEELAAAETIVDQWQRAEPGFRQLTWAELEARMTADERRFEADSRRLAAERQARRAMFDPQRSAARLELLEYQARLQHALDGRDAPAHPPTTSSGNRHTPAGEVDEVAEFEQKIAAVYAQIGDPDTVVDEHGWLPAERRQIALTEFRRWREHQVGDLRRSVSDLQSRLAGPNLAKAERSELRDQLRQTQQRLQVLEDLPPVTTAEMCSECPRPLQWHSFTVSGNLVGWVGPCPAWPRWAERIRGIRAQMEQWAQREQERSAPVPDVPKPEPLAVIESNTPLAEVIERLSRIQVDYPDAQVRRGRRNSWEIWAAPEPTDEP